MLQSRALRRGQTWPVLKQWNLLNINFSYRTMFYGSWNSNHSFPSHLSNPVWSYRKEKPTNIGGIDRVHLKGEFIEGSFVNGVRERKLFGIALVKTSGHKRYIEPRIKLIEKIMFCVILQFFVRKFNAKPVALWGRIDNLNLSIKKK